jgi:hypothetical protein
VTDHKVVHHDWERSHPLDLTDEGLLADLEDRAEAADLALHEGKSKGCRLVSPRAVRITDIDQ